MSLHLSKQIVVDRRTIVAPAVGKPVEAVSILAFLQARQVDTSCYPPLILVASSVELLSEMEVVVRERDLVHGLVVSVNDTLAGKDLCELPKETKKEDEAISWVLLGASINGSSRQTYGTDHHILQPDPAEKCKSKVSL